MNNESIIIPVPGVDGIYCELHLMDITMPISLQDNITYHAVCSVCNNELAFRGFLRKDWDICETVCTYCNTKWAIRLTSKPWYSLVKYE